MSRSTTGAYGDFPAYYYEGGNQFGAFLLGKTPAMGWDERMEATLVPDRGPYVAPPRSNPSPRPTRSTHHQLMTWIRGTISPEGAGRILATLASARGNGADETHRDPYDALDKFALLCLSEAEQRLVLDRLRDAYAAARRVDERRRTKPQKSRPISSRSSQPRRERPTARSKSVVEVPFTCSLCGTQLSDSERADARANSALFLGQAYCTNDADKVRGVLGAKKERP